MREGVSFIAYSWFLLAVYLSILMDGWNDKCVKMAAFVSVYVEFMRFSFMSESVISAILELLCLRYCLATIQLGFFLSSSMDPASTPYEPVVHRSLTIIVFRKQISHCYFAHSSNHSCCQQSLCSYLYINYHLIASMSRLIATAFYLHHRTPGFIWYKEKV
jgi:hypothetical protein